jgi:phosphoserine phosphatase RsbU/P
MAADFCTHHLASALSPESLQRLLAALAEATSTTLALFSAAGEIAVGPVAGSGMSRCLLETAGGRELVLAAHRAAMQGALATPDGGDSSPAILSEHLDHFAVPIIRGGQRAGMLTIGDRPRRPLSDPAVQAIAAAAGIEVEPLIAAARDLPCWTAGQAEATRNLAAAVVELFASLCMQDEDLRHRIEELTAVYNIAGLLAGSTDLQDILNKTAGMVCDVMKVKACSIRLLDANTGLLTVKAVHNLSWEYLEKGPVSVNSNPIDQAAVNGELIRIADMPDDPRVQYPEQARREGIVSGLVCGLIYRGKAVGVIRVYTGEPHTFSAYEESLLQAVASQAAAAIINNRLLSETIAAERYARQIAYAGDVQRRMVPRQPPSSKQVEIGALYRPTYLVGGDFYDFIKLPKGNLGIGIADVSGKGVPASLQMASLRSALRVYAYFTYDVDKIMSGVNRHTCRDTRTGEFTTAFYGVLTPDGRRLTYCNAGHDPPMHLRNGKITYLETGGMVLGVDEKAAFERGILDLQPGDILFLYTDGVVEALNFADEQFGRPRLAESLICHADQPAERIVQSINWDLRRFRGLADRLDDVTMVVLKIR